MNANDTGSRERYGATGRGGSRAGRFEGGGWWGGLVTGVATAAALFALGWAPGVAPVGARPDAGTTAGTAVPRDPRPGGRDDGSAADAWLALLETDGLEGARLRLRETALPGEPQPARPDPAAILARAVDALAEGTPTLAVDAATLAVIVDPLRLDAYAVLADACLAAGDGPCAERAYRALARVRATSGR